MHLALASTSLMHLNGHVKREKKPLRLANNFWMISVNLFTVAAPAPPLHLAHIPNLKRVCYLRLE